MARVVLAGTHGQTVDWALTGALALAAVAAALLLGLSLAPFLRRRSRPYLLVALALLALLARPAVGTLAMAGVVDAPTHHLVEHVLDVVLAALVFAAVWYARSPARERSKP